MESNEARFIQLAQQIGLMGVKASNAYNEAQASLELDQVLTVGRLSNSDGVGASLDTLEWLAALTSAHREAFAKFMTGAVSQLTAVLAEIPEQRAEAIRKSLVKSVNWNLNAQKIFYDQREKWIATAREICRLVESRRESISFSEDGLTFDNEQDLEQFTHLASTADHLHQLEVAQMAERLGRLKESLSVLGVQ
jgi:hypothetical protein